VLGSEIGDITPCVPTDASETHGFSENLHPVITTQNNPSSEAHETTDNHTEPTIQQQPCATTDSIPPLEPPLNSARDAGDDLQRFLDFVSGTSNAPILSTPPRVSEIPDAPSHPITAPNA
jgi:hypothetical protein